MIWHILEARAEIEKYFHSFKTSKSHSEMIWPLARNSTLRSFYKAFLKNIRSKALCVGGEIDIYEAINLCFFQGDSSI